MRLTPRQAEALALLYMVRDMDVHGAGKGWFRFREDHVRNTFKCQSCHVTTAFPFSQTGELNPAYPKSVLVSLRKAGLVESYILNGVPVHRITRAGILRFTDPATFLVKEVMSS